MKRRPATDLVGWVASKKRSTARAARIEARALQVLDYTGWVPFACAIAAIMTVALAGITWVTSPEWGNNPHARAQNKGTVPTLNAVQSPVADIVAPNRIEIPKIHANAPIVPVGTTPDGELEIPLNPKVVGWWHYGAKPGATVGTAILAGHINYAGVTGEMAEIGRLDPGDEVYVFGRQNANSKHEVRFTVTGVRTYHKTHLPYQQIFDQKSVGRIVIVTCGGPFDAATGNYLDNIVVFAVPETHGTVTPGIPGLRAATPTPSDQAGG
jgi:Sortase domain